MNADVARIIGCTSDMGPGRNEMWWRADNSFVEPGAQVYDADDLARWLGELGQHPSIYPYYHSDQSHKGWVVEYGDDDLMLQADAPTILEALEQLALKIGAS